MATPTVENYLKTLLALAEDGGQVSLSDLSKSLGVSTPSANNMVKKLSERGLVEYQKYRPLALTPAGRQEAALIVRKHRLTEMFLVEQMGFGWEEVHPIAEQIEHVKSPAFFARMDELMGFPTTDPHGSPIPDAEGNLSPEKRQRLSDCAEGQTAVVTGLAHSSSDFLLLMNDRKIALQTEITVHHRAPFDGSLTVSYPGHERVVLSKTVGDCILVDA
ncbi:metal-dependent transcriptional regulator [Neolewinella lacunae]|uniref:Transcriptional regulator MntR n=1 Tax=Neolewinella lacunae TaxID=1517758 RepID=A0A923T9A9_9BACT|nr:metal-dependent transcriptional regulator [Neolewinella lacunae]MBC6996535.1 metal-dependent transcriptional regulator [Neolewinella lacunae]MDN3634900.1 metal-dependent transcriptional regulator [Neolewinella lacunae]